MLPSTVSFYFICCPTFFTSLLSCVYSCSLHVLCCHYVGSMFGGSASSFSLGGSGLSSGPSNSSLLSNVSLHNGGSVSAWQPGPSASTQSLPYQQPQSYAGFKPGKYGRPDKSLPYQQPQSYAGFKPGKYGRPDKSLPYQQPQSYAGFKPGKYGHPDYTVIAIPAVTVNTGFKVLKCVILIHSAIPTANHTRFKPYKHGHSQCHTNLYSQIQDSSHVSMAILIHSHCHTNSHNHIQDSSPMYGYSQCHTNLHIQIQAQAT